MGKYSNLLSEDVKEKIEIYIEQERLDPHDSLPSERHLAELFGVNRQTVRTALKHLRYEHRLYTVHGRGNFIAPAKYADDTSTMSSFTSGWESDGYHTKSKVLFLGIIESPLAVSTQLGLSLGSPVYALTRVRFINDDPVTYETSYLSSEICPGLDQYDFSNASLYDVLQKHFDVVPVSIDEKISAAHLSEDEKMELSSEDDLAICVKSLAYDENGTPLEYCVAMTGADKMMLVSNLKVI